MGYSFAFPASPTYSKPMTERKKEKDKEEYLKYKLAGLEQSGRDLVLSPPVV